MRRNPCRDPARSSSYPPWAWGSPRPSPPAGARRTKAPTPSPPPTPPPKPSKPPTPRPEPPPPTPPAPPPPPPRSAPTPPTPPPRRAPRAGAGVACALLYLPRGQTSSRPRLRREDTMRLDTRFTRGIQLALAGTLAAASLASPAAADHGRRYKHYPRFTHVYVAPSPGRAHIRPRSGRPPPPPGLFRRPAAGRPGPPARG